MEANGNVAKASRLKSVKKSGNCHSVDVTILTGLRRVTKTVVIGGGPPSRLVLGTATVGQVAKVGVVAAGLTLHSSERAVIQNKKVELNETWKVGWTPIIVINYEVNNLGDDASSDDVSDDDDDEAASVETSDEENKPPAKRPNISAHVAAPVVANAAVRVAVAALPCPTPSVLQGSVVDPPAPSAG